MLDETARSLAVHADRYIQLITLLVNGCWLSLLPCPVACQWHSGLRWLASRYPNKEAKLRQPTIGIDLGDFAVPTNYSQLLQTATRSASSTKT